MSQPKHEATCHDPLNQHPDGTYDVEACTASSPSPRFRDHRVLAIISIICGLSCIGIVSLINSVKAREAQKKPNPTKAREYSRKALKWGVISIVTWVCLLILFPLLTGLISYLLTFIN